MLRGIAVILIVVGAVLGVRWVLEEREKPLCPSGVSQVKVDGRMQDCRFTFGVPPGDGTVQP
jgi:hypothetical protein